MYIQLSASCNVIGRENGLQCRSNCSKCMSHMWSQGKGDPKRDELTGAVTALLATQGSLFIFAGRKTGFICVFGFYLG